MTSSTFESISHYLGRTYPEETMNTDSSAIFLCKFVVEVPRHRTKKVEDIAWPNVNVNCLQSKKKLDDVPLHQDPLGGPATLDKGDRNTRRFNKRQIIGKTTRRATASIA